MRFFSVLILGVILFLAKDLKGQVSFDFKTSPHILFDFNTIQKYESGIAYMNAVTLNIDAGKSFDLYVGAETTNAGKWDVISTYSNIGAEPTIDILEIQFRNANSTSLISGFFQLQDIATPTYIIGSNLSPEADIACPANGTNAAGDYNSNPGCYKFRVDLKIKPGFTYQSGQYYLEVKFVIVEDL
jgi:hypothetical protein